jgi:hypothetical protein
MPHLSHLSLPPIVCQPEVQKDNVMGRPSLYTGPPHLPRLVSCTLLLPLQLDSAHQGRGQVIGGGMLPHVGGGEQLGERGKVAGQAKVRQ